jgi:hypothetical protein
MPITEIVGEGVALAIELGRDATASRAPRRKLFEPRLVVRQSTAPPGAATAPRITRTSAAAD